MIQDIFPHQFHPEYLPHPPKDDDFVLIFDRKGVFLSDGGFPDYRAVKTAVPALKEGMRYLFSVDDRAFYLAGTDAADGQGAFLRHENTQQLFREMEPGWLAFAGATGRHLYEWYRAHRFCGVCGSPFSHSETERALVCKGCGMIAYPRISPVVMAAVTDGDRILVTRYANRPIRRYSMVAGFVEVGETFEDAVHREVMEEVGLKIKNVRYYKSQPWAFTGTLLAGFFAEADGEPEIRVDHSELADAEWLHWRDIPGNESVDLSGFSLSSALVKAFYAMKSGE